jgi:uncharacterized protein (DUF2237 family)
VPPDVGYLLWGERRLQRVGHSGMADTESTAEGVRSKGRNVLGQPLDVCGCEPMTGFYRTGCCDTGPEDLGVHTICCVVNEEFLRVSKLMGNDLSTPMPQYGFEGLKPGDRWCVCAARWLQVEQAGAGCPIVLEATHEATLDIVPFETLIRYAVIPETLH